jgi:hypothetical protein
MRARAEGSTTPHAPRPAPRTRAYLAQLGVVGESAAIDGVKPIGELRAEVVVLAKDAVQDLEQVLIVQRIPQDDSIGAATAWGQGVGWAGL